MKKGKVSLLIAKKQEDRTKKKTPNDHLKDQNIYTKYTKKKPITNKVKISTLTFSVTKL